MNADRNDELIAGAIAGLPYRKAPAGFRARVLARIEAEAARAFDWQGAFLKGIGILTAGWTALLGALSAGYLYRGLSGWGEALARPGGFGQALDAAKAYAAHALGWLPGAISLFADLGRLAAAALPPWYETAAAALVCAAVIKAVPGVRPASGRI
ncbi:MAG: hypothetical protein M0025_09650 [Elusimicrobia bacterium]|nr:hypothetical protein [Elusimicrobiota bacterium]